MDCRYVFGRISALDTTFWELYPALHNIVQHKGDTVATVMVFSPLNVTFIERFNGA
jgi:hypothetical protein